MCDDDLFDLNTNTDDLLDYVSDGDIISTEVAPSCSSASLIVSYYSLTDDACSLSSILFALPQDGGFIETVGRVTETGICYALTSLTQRVRNEREACRVEHPSQVRYLVGCLVPTDKNVKRHLDYELDRALAQLFTTLETVHNVGDC